MPTPIHSRRRRALTLAFAGTIWVTAAGTRAAEKSFDVRIENGRVAESLRRIRVTEGDFVRLRFTVDRPVTLHLHGYDIEQRIVPGMPAEMAFAARATGRFPLHAHGSGASATQGSHEEAPVLYVEVYPR